ncbi:LysR family transcriptional regulator [Phenylobacterium sp. LjRoot164]|uniref:LysR family transcriptional regulator n=1 Tax=unclassified Phenylobacterium TaxID=2640670 RepID=UPI003ECD1B5E
MDDLERSLRQTNLNLLPVLREILKHRNLTRAAEELNLTQAAVSNSLRRLRDHFGDDLLVKDGRGLRLTEKARRMVGPLEAALAAVADVLAGEAFAPERSRRRYRIATADYVTAVLTPNLTRLLGEEAPLMSVQMVTARGRSAEDLRLENIDILISPRQIISAAIFDAPRVMAEFAFEDLARDPFVCLGRADDADLAAGLSREAYLARPHASFFLDLDVHASLEHAYLLENGIGQFDRLLTSDFSVLPLVAAASDCLTLVPSSLAAAAIRSLPLQSVPSPLPVPDLELVMIWLKRRDADPEIRWLREALRRCAPAFSPLDPSV